MASREMELIAQIADGCSKLTEECQRLQHNFDLQQRMINELLKAVEQNSEQIQHNNEGIKIVMEVLKVNGLV